MKDRFNIFTSLSCWIATAVQSSYWFQIVSLIFSILCSLLTIIFTIWRWYRKAKQDGIIDDKEIEELEDILKKGDKKNE